MGSQPEQSTQPSKKITSILLVILVSNVALLGLAMVAWKSSLDVQNNQISDLKNQINQLQSQIFTLTTQLLSSPNFSFTLPSNFTYTQIYDAVRDSVVTVHCVVRDSYGAYSSVQGSGFVYNYTGRIVVITNNHVVDNAINITITFGNGDSYPSQLLGKDHFSDLAVLSTTAPTHELKPIRITSSSSLQVGQPVIAIGSPYGLTGSMTVGIVSQLGRTITEAEAGGYAIADVIQTSAPINPGNSGGPLLNVFGEVVGINTAIVENSQGLGFAIPSDTILRELPYLVTGQPFPHPWLGVRGADVTYELARAIKLNVTYGWFIQSVTANGPAARAGLRGGQTDITVSGDTYKNGGDVIIAINGVRIRNGDDLSTYLAKSTVAGQTIQITVLRATRQGTSYIYNQKITVNLVLGVRPSA